MGLLNLSDLKGIADPGLLQGPQAQQVAPVRRGLLAPGSIGNAIMGSLADGLASNFGAQPMYQPMMMQKRQDDREDQRFQRRQGLEMNQKIALEKWKRQNPDPRYFESNNGDQYMIGPDGQPRKVFADPTPKTSWTAVDNGDGTKQLVPIVNGVPQLGGPSAPATTGGLPPGYTVRGKGGAPSQGGGTFR